MRLKAFIHTDVIWKKAIIYALYEDTYLFIYDTTEDRGSLADYWFESGADAHAYCNDTFGLTERNWEMIADPLPGMQHDWERPTCAIRHADGRIECVSVESEQNTNESKSSA